LKNGWAHLINNYELFSILGLYFISLIFENEKRKRGNNPGGVDRSIRDPE